MRRILELSYDGTPFCGWQRQPNAPSVQQRVEEALSTILRKETAVTGAGRTDTGVHARNMTAHFDFEGEFPGKERFLTGMNRLCGHAISINDVTEVDSAFHARFDAKRRTYKYFVSFGKSPFTVAHAWHSPAVLDLDAMNRAAELLLQTDDFSSFAKLHSDAKTNICRVDEARWDMWTSEWGGDGAVFTVSADRFLRNMVRALVGTLIEVGRGKMDAEGFRRVIEAHDRCSAGTSMPAHGLFLWEISY